MSGSSVVEPEWDQERMGPRPLVGRWAWIWRQAGAEKLGASLDELPEGAAVSLLHVRHGSEEVLVVLSGRSTLRTLDEERELAPGDVAAPRRAAAAPTGSRTAGTRPRAPIVSTRISPEVAEYPDGGTVGILSEPGPGESMRLMVRSPEESPGDDDGGAEEG